MIMKPFSTTACAPRKIAVKRELRCFEELSRQLPENGLRGRRTSRAVHLAMLEIRGHFRSRLPRFEGDCTLWRRPWIIRRVSGPFG